MHALTDPIRLGAVVAPNRILMAPLTRGRATRDFVPTPSMAEYYAQRASAGLILSEAIGVNREGLGWPYAPGIWSDEQAEAWKPVTAAVHRAGGRIFAQLWHMGRTVHPSFLDGKPPVSASATQAEGQGHTYSGKQDYVMSRALTLDDIKTLLEDYRQGALNAKAAGFDGVQIHAANGHLPDQFLRDGTNLRTDRYGGTIGKRIRFLCEVTEVVADVFGADRTAVRLSPNDGAPGAPFDSDPRSLFRAVAQVLGAMKLAFLELRASRPDSTFRAAERDLAPVLRAAFEGPLVLNSDYTAERAAAALAAGEADAISFGRPFIANPDLPHRISRNLPLNESNMATWYSQGREGYVDYPCYDDGEA